MGDSTGGSASEAGIVGRADMQKVKCETCGKEFNNAQGLRVHQGKKICRPPGQEVVNDRTERCLKCSAYFKKAGIKIHERTCNPAKVIQAKVASFSHIGTPTAVDVTQVPVIPPQDPTLPTLDSTLASLREKWSVQFQSFCDELSEDRYAEFENALQAFIQEINDCTPQTPKRTIKHPTVLYHQKKDSAEFERRKATCQTSNPHRKDERISEATKRN